MQVALAILPHVLSVPAHSGCLATGAPSTEARRRAQGPHFVCVSFTIEPQGGFLRDGDYSFVKGERLGLEFL